jgi:hypothetical protein
LGQIIQLEPSVIYQSVFEPESAQGEGFSYEHSKQLQRPTFRITSMTTPMDCKAGLPSHGRGLQRAKLGLMLGLLMCAGQAFAGSILFIGNSFTYGAESPVQYYRADTVTDLNRQGKGGVPALFKSFT